MTLAEHAELTWAHIARSASMSIDRARRLLGYRPRYTSLQAIAEALQWLPRHGEVDIGPDELTRLTQPHRDREAILEGVGSSRHCPPGSNNGRCGPRTDTTTHRSCPVARPNGSRQCVRRWFVSPATGFDLPESTLWTLCEARIRPDDRFINLVPFRVQARGVNVWLPSCPNAPGGLVVIHNHDCLDAG